MISYAGGSMIGVFFAVYGEADFVNNFNALVIFNNGIIQSN